MGLLNCILFNSIQLLLFLPLFLSLPIHTMLYPDFFLEHFFLLHLTQGHSQLTHATLQLGFETPAPQSLSAPHLLQHSLSRCFIFPPNNLPKTSYNPDFIDEQSILPQWQISLIKQSSKNPSVILAAMLPKLMGKWKFATEKHSDLSYTHT